jgi:metallo-beta-lactamase class B
MDVKEGAEPHKVIFFCSAMVALNQLVKNPTYPGIVEDYRSTFKRAALLDGDVFLAPHPEMYNMGRSARRSPKASRTRSSSPANSRPMSEL